MWISNSLKMEAVMRNDPVLDFLDRIEEISDKNVLISIKNMLDVNLDVLKMARKNNPRLKKDILAIKRYIVNAKRSTISRIKRGDNE